MADSDSFPLLRLPCLARDHVVILMDIREQYLFAKLSMNSKRVVKVGARRLSYTVKWYLKFDAVSCKYRKAGNQHAFKINILAVNKIDLENIYKEAMALLEFLNDIFKISSFTLKCFLVPNDLTKQFLATVKHLKIRIDFLEVLRTNRDGNEMFEWVMANCRDARRLRNFCETTRGFQWDSQEPFTSEYIYLWNAPWLTLNHLRRLFMDCRFFEICTREHQLTNDDLKQIVQLWMNDSNWESFRVTLTQHVREQTDFNFIMQDIEKEPVRRAYIENHLVRFKAGQAFKVRQNNGKEAVVCILHRTDFRITTHFDNRRCDFWHI